MNFFCIKLFIFFLFFMYMILIVNIILWNIVIIIKKRLCVDICYYKLRKLIKKVRNVIGDKMVLVELV